MEIYLLASFLFGAITAFIAINKKRNGAGWFILGSILGPLALILSLLVSPNKKHHQQVVIDDELN